MSAGGLKHHFIEAMAKHLPPSASTLKLVDINGQAGDILTQRRADLSVQVVVDSAVDDWDVPENSVDAVVGYNIDLNPAILNQVLTMMRAGGRFIVVLSEGDVSAEYVELLEKHGYVRILVESAVDDLGVLIRGEKVHNTDDTLARIQQVATSDADMLDLATFKGRYVHLLIRQTPNKPVWKLEPDEKIQWQAVTIKRDHRQVVLGFSSLPKAVGFMQPAVMAGVIQDINKVGKFSKQTASDWAWDVLLNPTLEAIQDAELALIDIDPDTAEAPDE